MFGFLGYLGGRGLDLESGGLEKSGGTLLKTNSILARTAKVMAVVISAKQLALNSLDFIISKYLVYITTIYKYY